MAIEKNTPNYLIHEQLPFTTLINDTIKIITDCSALGIYVYLASKPEKWNICIQHLMNHFGKGRDFIMSKLKYLRSLNALEVINERDEKGKFISRQTILRRSIKPTVLKTPSVDNPECGQNDTSNTRDLEKEKRETTTSSSVFSEETDKELLELRNKHMPSDSRTNELFLLHGQWHVEHGDTKKFNYPRRLAGLKSLIRKGDFQEPADYPKQKKEIGVSLLVQYSAYANGIKKDKELGVIASDTILLSYEEWIKTYVPS